MMKMMKKIIGIMMLTGILSGCITTARSWHTANTELPNMIFKAHIEEGEDIVEELGGYFWTDKMKLSLVVKRDRFIINIINQTNEKLYINLVNNTYQGFDGKLQQLHEYEVEAHEVDNPSVAVLPPNGIYKGFWVPDNNLTNIKHETGEVGGIFIDADLFELEKGSRVSDTATIKFTVSHNPSGSDVVDRFVFEMQPSDMIEFFGE